MRTTNKWVNYLIICLLVIVVVFFIIKYFGAEGPASNEQTKIKLPATRDNNLALGNPSKAGKTDKNNYLILRPQYALSYNNSKGEANWVSWHLSSAWKGSAPRSAGFTTDTLLPKSFTRVTTKDYNNSGFDRGHLCPSDDRDGSIADNEATFLMDNIIPQAPKNNQQTWKELEDYSRRLIYEGNELYIIAGSYGKGGINKNNEFKNTIAKGKILVPSNIWKIIVVLPIGNNDAERIANSTRIIAVDMPNKQSVSTHSWTYYKTSVDELEAKTKFDFLSNVPAAIQDVIEKRVDR